MSGYYTALGTDKPNTFGTGEAATVSNSLESAGTIKGSPKPTNFGLKNADPIFSCKGGSSSKTEYGD